MGGCSYKTSLIPPFFIEVSVSSQERSGHVYMCVKGMNFLLYFGSVLMVRNFFLFILSEINCL